MFATPAHESLREWGGTYQPPHSVRATGRRTPHSVRYEVADTLARTLWWLIRPSPFPGDGLLDGHAGSLLRRRMGQGSLLLHRERKSLSDNLLFRIRFIIAMIRLAGLAP
jgi:hypothetical protein